MRNVDNKIRKGNVAKKGFTLIELSLSIVFISILSISIALVINDAVASYQRGLTLNKVNFTGQSLVDDMRTAVQNSYTRSMIQECSFKYGREKCESDSAYRYVAVVTTAKIYKVQSADTSGLEVPVVPVSGAFCTGNYSYIWNSGYYFSNYDYTIDSHYPSARLIGNWPDESGIVSTHEITDFKLLKVKDDYRKVCRSVIDDTQYDQYKPETWKFDITSFGAIDETPIDLLGEDLDNNLAIYNFFVAKPAFSNARKNFFYSASFVLGTMQGGVNILESGNYCTPPEGYTSYENFNYCSINKFNFAAQAIGG